MEAGKELLSATAESLKSAVQGLSGNPQSAMTSSPNANTTGPAISESPSGGLINAAGVEGFDSKYKGPATLASGERVPASGYNAVGEPLITGDDGKKYRASKTTHS
jgi:hypothetical protein